MRKMIPILFLVAYFIACAGKSVDSGVEGLTKNVYEFEAGGSGRFEIPGIRVSNPPIVQVWNHELIDESLPYPWPTSWNIHTGGLTIEDDAIIVWHYLPSYEYRIVVIR